MEKEQFVKCMTYLGIAYNKEYSKFEVEQHYEFLKEYSYDELKNDNSKYWFFDIFFNQKLIKSFKKRKITFLFMTGSSSWFAL